MSAPDKMDTCELGTEWCSVVRVGWFLCQFCLRCWGALGKRGNKTFLLWLAAFYSQVKTWTGWCSLYSPNNVLLPIWISLFPVVKSISQNRLIQVLLLWEHTLFIDRVKKDRTVSYQDRELPSPLHWYTHKCSCQSFLYSILALDVKIPSHTCRPSYHRLFNETSSKDAASPNWFVTGKLFFLLGAKHQSQIYFYIGHYIAAEG